ncbi:HAD superfamily (subfamily IIIA) phosphatase, TIGR01668 [Paenibacillus curdlanolyticus YK9]|uniref:HAD superfamily (Subfamily IIIA) phosphatase, TIGR01668 n=1 Tax=Paenibacillus curdlanolyticus YK9 TaxID=717606 RepID=E0I340_9BACL|nr:YqeG family HAD IIIA-type phosphatase [Paenibacillus curdlanolyticus]EFM12704.1 HAD superfamily (subfamily IIIA) phosphatase, TIGR01668 [Paenibacillus curdlanolyticus YK9]
MFERLLPNLRLNSVYDLDIEALARQGIKGIITDLDNTLVGAKEPLATPRLVEWLNKLRERGFKVVIVSNNNETRVSRFANPLGIPYIHAARKPANRAFHRAFELLALSPEQVVIMGDQMLTDVLGGNRLGVYTILVPPISPRDEGIMTRVNRFIERIALTRLRKNGLWHEEETK